MDMIPGTQPGQSALLPWKKCLMNTKVSSLAQRVIDHIDLVLDIRLEGFIRPDDFNKENTECLMVICEMLNDL